MGRIEDIFKGLSEPDPERHSPDRLIGRSATKAPVEEVGPSRIVYFDRLEPGQVFLTPQPCDGDCGFPATTHTAGKYHEALIIDRRTEGPLTVVIFTDEDLTQQSVGPVPNFMPIRVKVDLGDTGRLGEG